jgi:hypothetical protein
MMPHWQLCGCSKGPSLVDTGQIGSYGDHRLSTTRSGSPSAVSEAPMSEELGVETLWRGASDTAT